MTVLLRSIIRNLWHNVALIFSILSVALVLFGCKNSETIQHRFAKGYKVTDILYAKRFATENCGYFSGDHISKVFESQYEIDSCGIDSCLYSQKFYMSGLRQRTFGKSRWLKWFADDQVCREHFDTQYLTNKPSKDSGSIRVNLSASTRQFLSSASAVMDGSLHSRAFSYRLLMGARRSNRKVLGGNSTALPLRELMLYEEGQHFMLSYSEYWVEQKVIISVINQEVNAEFLVKFDSLINYYHGGVFLNPWRVDFCWPDIGYDKRGRINGPCFQRFSDTSDARYYNYSAIAESYTVGGYQLSYGLVGDYCYQRCGSTMGGLNSLLPGIRDLIQPMLRAAIAHQMSYLKGGGDEDMKRFWSSENFWYYDYNYQLTTLNRCIGP